MAALRQKAFHQNSFLSIWGLFNSPTSIYPDYHYLLYRSMISKEVSINTQDIVDLK